MRSTTDPADAGSGLEMLEPIQSFEIWPHRSLTRAGQGRLLALVAFGASLSVLRLPSAAVLPLATGAVATVGALALALWCNNRAARFGERVEIGPDVVRVVRCQARGMVELMRFSTGWVRVAVTHDREMTHRVTLTERGRSCSIGACLSPEERQALAKAISDCLHSARSPPPAT